jgi:hypothetical protein
MHQLIGAPLATSNAENTDEVSHISNLLAETSAQ